MASAWRTLMKAGAAAAVSAGCASAPKPFLWKLEKGGRESWLLGTVHAGVPAAEIPPLAVEKLESSSTYVAELDARPTDKNPHAALELSSESPGLDELLSKPAWAKLQERLRGAPPDRLKRMNPFFAIYLLDDVEKRENAAKAAEPPAPAAKPAKDALSMDEWLLGKARARGMVISYLDEKTPSLRSCVDRAVARDLEEKLAPKKTDAQAKAEADSDLANVARAYRAGDLGKISALEAEEEKESGGAGECTVESRNRAWAEKIARLHEVYAPAFVAVGVGHMATPADSLIELLKQQGFTVDRAATAARSDAKR